MQQQAEKEAAGGEQASDGSQAGSDDEGHSGSRAGSFSSSSPSSFSGSMPSMAGSPLGAATAGVEGLEQPREAASGGGSPRNGAMHGDGPRQEQRARLKRSVTSRGRGGFGLRSSSPGREISTHLRVSRAALRCPVHHMASGLGIDDIALPGWLAWYRQAGSQTGRRADVTFVPAAAACLLVGGLLQSCPS